MYLFLNNLTKEKVYLAIFNNKKKLVKERFLVKEKRSGANILKGLEEILANSKLSLEDVRAIVVVNGPGRFSAIRKALSIGNTIGWLKDIPVIGVSFSKDDCQNKELFLKGIKKINNKVNFHIAEPYYGKEPNIS